MTFALAFWILMLIWFVFGVLWPAATGPWHPIVNAALLFVLFLLLGWKVFGPPLHG